MQTAAARTVTEGRKIDHVTPILKQLHRLPIHKRICHKILAATYRSVQKYPSLPLWPSPYTHRFSRSHDQHLDLSLMFPRPGIIRQKGTASEPSGLSLPPSGMSSTEHYLQGRVSALGPCMPHFQSTPWWVPLPSGRCAYPSMHTRLNLFSARCSGSQCYTIIPNLATQWPSSLKDTIWTRPRWNKVIQILHPPPTPPSFCKRGWRGMGGRKKRMVQPKFSSTKREEEKTPSKSVKTLSRASPEVLDWFKLAWTCDWKTKQTKKKRRTKSVTRQQINQKPSQSL